MAWRIVREQIGVHATDGLSSMTVPTMVPSPKMTVAILRNVDAISHHHKLPWVESTNVRRKLFMPLALGQFSKCSVSTYPGFASLLLAVGATYVASFCCCFYGLSLYQVVLAHAGVNKKIIEAQWQLELVQTGL